MQFRTFQLYHISYPMGNIFLHFSMMLKRRIKRDKEARFLRSMLLRNFEYPCFGPTLHFHPYFLRWCKMASTLSTRVPFFSPLQIYYFRNFLIPRKQVLFKLVSQGIKERTLKVWREGRNTKRANCNEIVMHAVENFQGFIQIIINIYSFENKNLKSKNKNII